jgi:hypothetical protein
MDARSSMIGNVVPMKMGARFLTRRFEVGTILPLGIFMSGYAHLWRRHGCWQRLGGYRKGLYSGTLMGQMKMSRIELAVGLSAYHSEKCFSIVAASSATDLIGDFRTVVLSHFDPATQTRGF